MTEDREEREAFSEGFIGIQKSELENKPDAELAAWHAGWKPGTAQHILAEKEWLRRLSIRQLQEQFRLDARLAELNNRTMRFAAIIGVLGTLAGAGLGVFATLKTGSAQTSHPASLSQAQAAPETPKGQAIPSTAQASASKK